MTAPQKQYSLTQQLREVADLAQREGYYDAADWIRGRLDDKTDIILDRDEAEHLAELLKRPPQPTPALVEAMTELLKRPPQPTPAPVEAMKRKP